MFMAVVLLLPLRLHKPFGCCGCQQLQAAFATAAARFGQIKRGEHVGERSRQIIVSPDVQPCIQKFFKLPKPKGEYGDCYCDANCVGGNCCNDSWHLTIESSSSSVLPCQLCLRSLI